MNKQAKNPFKSKLMIGENKKENPFDKKSERTFTPEDFSIGEIENEKLIMIKMIEQYTMSRQRYAKMGAISNEMALKDIQKAHALLKKLEK